MARIFISYRRDDSAGHAGRLFDRLADRFGEDQVFLDVGTIDAGADFVDAIEQAVTSCDALIVVIGPRWSSVTDELGRRRIDLENDFVRLEVQTAMERRLPTIPVLVGGAAMPTISELPDPISRLGRLNALEIADGRFNADAARMLDAIDRLLKEATATSAGPASSAPPIAEAPESAAQTRKVVTVLAIDTRDEASSSVDLEARSASRDGWARSLADIAETYGGIVDRSDESGATLVFGVPRLHEDDAARAVLAAVAVREMAAERGSTTTGIGLDTGEVLVDAHSDGYAVSGPPLRSAEAFSHRAAAGGISLGDVTYRLARDVVVVEPDEGPEDAAWRLIDVEEGGLGSRRPTGTLVGRSDELRMLAQAFERSTRDRTCHLVTVIGGAGVGKSRLISEFLASVEGRATVLTGRCLAYGKGITYWPIAEMIRAAAEIPYAGSRDDAVEHIEALLEGADDGELISSRVLHILGLTDPSFPPEEAFWAIRRFFEHLASKQPLIVVVEDIHWAEPTLLDLLDHVTDWSRSEPILLVCLARHDLLDHRPSWGGGKLNATLMTLQPLDETDAVALVDELVGSSVLSVVLRDRIMAAAEGNPLFVEEMIAKLIDDGVLEQREGRWVPVGDLSDVSVPPTISALLAARVDQLGEDERDVVQRASVVGRDFFRGAVEELSPSSLRPRIAAELLSLTRRDLIRPVPSSFFGEEEFHFRHVLIQDAAYRALPKRLRAKLHRIFADWVERRAGERSPEYEEIMAYHLEQSFRYLEELEPASQELSAIAARAADMLTRAGHRAFSRGDMPAAVNLLSRAVAVLPENAIESLELLPELGEALFETGDLAQSDALLRASIEGAAQLGNERLEAYAIVIRLLLQILTEPTGWADEAERAAERVAPIFERAGDNAALAKTWELLHHVHIIHGEYAEAERASLRASEYAALDGRPELEARHLAIRAATSAFGPTPVEEGLRRCEQALERSKGYPSAEAQVLLGMAGLEAMRGSVDEARRLIVRARDLWTDLGMQLIAVSAVAQYAGFVELLAEDWVAAERELRAGFDALEQMGELGVRSSVAAALARAVCEQGRSDEAMQLSQISEESAAADDIDAQVEWRGVRGRLLAEAGPTAEAEALAREGVALADPTDDLGLRAGAHLNLARVLAVWDRKDEARKHVEEAIRLYEQKGNLLAASHTRSLALGTSTETVPPGR